MRRQHLVPGLCRASLRLAVWAAGAVGRRCQEGDYVGRRTVVVDIQDLRVSLEVPLNFLAPRSWTVCCVESLIVFI